MTAPRGILTDVEGTTTPLAYVKDVLFPYARSRLPGFLAEAAAEPAVRAALAEVARLAPGEPALAALLAWMQADAKVTPLKTLQGLIWHQGYQAGDLQASLYADVAPALRRWHRQGIRLDVYSSGSAMAQELLFSHTGQGNLAALFSTFNDTRIGPKQDHASYRRIVAAGPYRAADWLFLSDSPAELDAAAAAGLRTCQLTRPDAPVEPAAGHASAPDFDGVEAAWHAPA